MASNLPALVFRVLRGSTPIESDFRTAREMNRRIPPDTLAQWPRIGDGYSLWDDRGEAESVARVYSLGDWIGKLDLRLSEVIEIEQTLKNPHHWTAYGPPEELVRIVVDVTKVPE